MTDPTAPAVQAGPASLTTTPTSLPKIAQIDARFLIAKSGAALIEVRTGTFDDATNTGTPNGYFDKITYTVKNPQGKVVQTRTISFKKSSVSTYAEGIDLCSSNNRDDDDDDDGGSGPHLPNCSTVITPSYSISVTAALRGFGGDSKKTGTVTAPAVAMYFPDINLTNQKLYTVDATGAETVASTVAPGVVTTYALTFPNNTIPGAAGAAGINGICGVTVNGFPQLPLGKFSPTNFSYVGDPSPSATPGGTATCSFTLKLPAGPATICVTVLPVYPFDYDLSNNTSCNTVVVTTTPPTPLDVSAGPLQQQIGSGTPPTYGAVSDVKPNVTTNYSVAFSASGSGTASGLQCSVSAIKQNDPANTAATVTPNPLPKINVSASAPASCVFSLSYPSAGDYTVKVAAPVPGGDASAANDTSTTTVHVADNAVAPYVSLSNATVVLANGQPVPSSVSSGTATNFGIAVTLTGTATGVIVTCKASVDGGTTVATGSSQATSATTTGTVVVCPLAQAITLTGNTTSLSDVTHTIQATATTIIADQQGTVETASANASVAATIREDVAVQNLRRTDGGVLNTLALGAAGAYAYDIVNPASGSYPATVACDVVANTGTTGNLPLTGVISQLTSGTTTLQPGQTTTCSFVLTFNAEGGPQITAMADVSSPVDNNLANNSQSFTVNVAGSQFFPNDAAALAAGSEDWVTTSSTDPNATPVLTHQVLGVSNLALIVIQNPDQTSLGRFTLNGSLIDSAGTTIASGVVATGTLGPGTATNFTCANTVTGATTLNAGRITASVCSSPAADPNEQQISVAFKEEAGSAFATAANTTIPSTAPRFGSNLTFKLTLTYCITGMDCMNGATADRTVTATIVVDMHSDFAPPIDLGTTPDTFKWTRGVLDRSIIH